MAAVVGAVSVVVLVVVVVVFGDNTGCDSHPDKFGWLAIVRT